MKIKNKTKKIASMFLAAALAVTPVLSGTLTANAGGKLDEPEAGVYYASDYSTKDELKTAGSALRKEIIDEGIVMLKNEDNALPLKTGAKISVFGKSTTKGTVFSSQSYSDKGFSVNPELVKFYGDNTRSGDGTASMEHGNYTLSGLITGETPIASYDDTVKNSYAEYNDAAIVYFYRSVGEGRDAPRTMMWDGSSYKINENSTQPVNGARDKDDHYMQLDQNESDLLKHVNDNFNKVIVVLVSGAQMETGFLDDKNHYAYQPNIKAAFWSGENDWSYQGLPSILKGEVNPSAKTVDTFYRDFKLDPTWQNFGNQLSYDGNFYTNGASGYAKAYVTYSEGIYMGYRYYETRGYEEGTAAYTSADGYFHGTTTKEWKDWYSAHVVYPYGYGLSYTTFKQEIVETSPEAQSELTKDGTIKVKVKVTNTGAVAGKDVVQLYYTSPYTKGGIEKAHVVLGDFNKTKMLQPGESDTLTVSFKVKDMASYDWDDKNTNGFKGYELDPGQYTVRLMRDSHTEIASVNYKLTDAVRYYTTDDTTTNSTNIFDTVSNYLTEDVGKQYMSRADFKGTFPTANVKLTAPDYVVNGMNEWNSSRDASLDQTKPYYTDKMPKTGADNGIMLKDLFGLDYNDEKWGQFLDQLTVDEMTKIVTQGNYWSGIDIPRLGITKEVNTDGIGGMFTYSGIHSDKVGSFSATSWGSQLLLAASFNKDLAYRKGRIIGNEGLWGGAKEYSKVAGYYAPGVNLTRSPFGGRNGQYFGEDPYLSGTLAAQIVKGAQDMGMFCYVKHFGLNEQETNRIGVLTWANEQSMRELYFRSFQITVEEGGTRAIMTSLNRIGYEWAGGSYELLTKLLREEWGFNGNVVTDSFIWSYSNADQMIRAGGNLALGTGSISYNVGTPTTVTALRNACHGLLYTHANSMAVNSSARPILPKKINSYSGKTLVTGSINQEYSASVATVVINPDYTNLTAADITYALAENSNPLPEGLTLNTDGTISGTPTEKKENYKITVVATLKGDVSTANFILNITEGKPQILYSVSESVLADGIKGETYSTSVAYAEIFAPNATDEEKANFPTITYALKGGYALPSGLRLTESGKIIGTPNYSFEGYKIVIVAVANGLESKQAEFTLTVYEKMEYAGKTLAKGKVGASYIQSVAFASGTEKGVAYSLKDGSTLPDGLKITAGGYIVGKPVTAVTDHKFTVVATSESAKPAEAEFTVTIGLAYGDSLVLPDGKVGEEYDAMINTAQGSFDITYALKEGTLPEGLTLTENGELTGTPTKAGVYTLTFVASSEGLEGDEITLTLYIANGENSGSTGEQKSGCNGVIGGLLPVTSALGILAAAVALRKKKED